jgi:hypothetical protein
MRRLATVWVLGLAAGCGGLESEESTETLGTQASGLLGTAGPGSKVASTILLQKGRQGAVTFGPSVSAQFVTRHVSDRSAEDVRLLLQDGEVEVLLREVVPTDTCVPLGGTSTPTGVLYRNADVGASVSLSLLTSPDEAFTFRRVRSPFPTVEGFFYFGASSPEPGRVTPGSHWRVNVPGEGAEIDTARIDGSLLTMPDFPGVTSPDLSGATPIDGTQPLTFHWDNAAFADSVQLQLSGVDAQGRTRGFSCIVKNTGSFTVPASFVEQLPASGRATVLARRVNRVANASDGRPHDNIGLAFEAGTFRVTAR